jgi:hypothetical protein
MFLDKFSTSEKFATKFTTKFGFFELKNFRCIKLVQVSVQNKENYQHRTPLLNSSIESNERERRKTVQSCEVDEDKEECECERDRSIRLFPV